MHSISQFKIALVCDYFRDGGDKRDSHPDFFVSYLSDLLCLEEIAKVHKGVSSKHFKKVLL